MRHLTVAMLGGAPGKVYIQLMRSRLFTSSWLPLFAVGLMEPASNPIGLGLLAMAGSAVGAVVIVLGLLASLVRHMR